MMDMLTRLKQNFCAIFALLICLPSFAQADGQLQFHSANANAQIIALSQFDGSTGSFAEADLVITGAYTQAERHAIDGLTFIDGYLKNRDIEDWDGIFLIHDDKAQIFDAGRVALDGEEYDLTASNELYTFTEVAKREKISLIQSHLLIRDGSLDIRDQGDTPKFVRRILFIDADNALGVWQSDEAKTLYEATRELFDTHHPIMAINLDMGAYDYCRMRVGDEFKNCGDPSAGLQALSNVIGLRD